MLGMNPSFLFVVTPLTKYPLIFFLQDALHNALMIPEVDLVQNSKFSDIFK